MLQRNSTEFDLTLLSPPFCLCILPPAAAEVLQVDLTVSSSVRSSRTSYWPLCSGGRLSQETMWQLQGITVNLKKKEKKDSYLKNAQVNMTVQQYLIRLSQKESYTTYLTRLRSHPDLTPQPEMEILTELKPTRCWWFLGTNRTGMGLLSLLLYLLVELVFMLAFVCFLFFFFNWGGGGCSLRRTIYLHLFQGREQE